MLARTKSGPKCFHVIRAFLLQILFFFALVPVVNASSAPDSHGADSDLVPDSIISMTSEDGPAHAIVVEKDTQTLSVYEYTDRFVLKHRFACSTGEVPGKKKTSGDRKTPEGIYLFTKAHKKRDLSPIYGNGAFVMDYPNLIDRRANRDGNSIWLHGTNKPLKPRDSNGCVAVENGHIDTLARYIRLNRTAIVIDKKLNMVSHESLAAEQEGLSRFLEDWKRAFLTGDKTKYYAFYDRAPAELDSLWQTWSPIRTAWQDARLSFEMSLKNMTLARGNPSVVAVFDQVMHMDGLAARIGTKKLFLEPTGSTWKIVGEVLQGASSNPEPTKPVANALARLDRLQKDHKETSRLIADWADAWSSKDIGRYRACYADDFYSRKMDLDAWIRYKKNLSKRYDSIQVSVEDLQIRENSDRTTATFVQRYRSSGHLSVGMKTIRLKRLGGQWRIYREMWLGSLIK